MCIWCEVRSNFIPLHMAIQLYQYYLLKILFFSLLNCLGTTIKNYLNCCMYGFISGLNFIPLIYMSILHQLLHCLDYHCFVVKSISLSPSNLFFFFKIFFFYNSGLFVFHMKFRIILSICTKKSSGILIGIMLIL